MDNTSVVPLHQKEREATRRLRKRRFKSNLPLLIMFTPVVLYFVIFKYVPMGGLIIAFKDYNFYDGVLNSPWVGLHYFEQLFQDPRTLEIIRNTFVLSLLSIVFGFPVPIILAIMLNEVRNMMFKRTVQTIVYMPHFLSWVIIAMMIMTMFSLENGLINKFVELFFGEPYPFMYNNGSWIAVFISSGIWKDMGFNAIIFLAALTTIDPSLYEAASMDGASKGKQIFHITLPGIRSTIILLLILSMGRVMEVGFDQVYMLQNSNVNEIADVISTYIYRTGLQGAQFSLTTAMGMFESLVAFVLVVGANYIARKYNEGLW
ncbi:putative multiple-sugar transport system permease YteP [Paenibacillus montaniterrae]|uniref:Multiple-sugar transport system permease YteP n=1 Tax=Paenibacillus montaniterrae TaxID=429341 RepID=A0A920CYX7_9BACL|nr:ABC transporter permease subunit [Paenibacillus montaniterrae]GIP16464.1 putative multiple-sugar transport system permease YteP [Paenibacillus montaniterrae]